MKLEVQLIRLVEKGARGIMEKLNSKVDKWLTPDGLMMLEAWTRDGFTNAQIAINKMGVAEKTLWKWRKDYPEIEEAMSRGREFIDYKVENALLKAALGYEVEEVKTIIESRPDKDGNRPVRIEKVVKQIAPNTTAIAIWLNNRRPNKWKRNRDNIIEFNDKDNNITVNIIKHSKANEEQEQEDEKKKVKTKSTKKPEEYVGDEWPDDWEE